MDESNPVLTPGVEPLVEYFVPRSLSEFDLSMASGDTPIHNTFLPLTMEEGGSGDSGGEYITKLSDLAGKTCELSELSAAISDFNSAKKELKQFKNFKICEDLKKCDDGCSCNAEADCDICKVLDFTSKKDKL
ncbi:hypothetical protein JTB14_017909 [Gonioctena quinquepunctata]|nr:hypothetical protein JTB14_017909 [Gonioctena quinquepunctata]